jgi:hypothetical protein
MAHVVHFPAGRAAGRATGRAAAPPAAAPARAGLLRRWLAAWRARAALREHARRERAAHEACAAEGGHVEFEVVELGGRRFGALYVGGKLSCLMPQVERL